MAISVPKEGNPLPRGLSALRAATSDRMGGFRLVYLAIFAFLLLSVFTVKGTERLLARHFQRTVAEAVNRVIRGYWNYYSLGTSGRLRRELHQYAWERMRIWGRRKHARPCKRKGMQRSRSGSLWAKVREAQALLLNPRTLPRHPAERRHAACLVQ